MSELRARQKALAREAMLDAVAGLIRERRHLDFSMQEVADGAGVSLRTVYNHFPSREALIDSLFDHSMQRMAEAGMVMVDQVHDADDLIAAIDTNFRIFSQFTELHQALAEVSGPDSAITSDHDRRTDKLVAIITDAIPQHDPEDVRPLAVLLRHLAANHSWLTLTERYGLTTEQATAQVTWAITTLMDAARAGDIPRAGGSR